MGRVELGANAASKPELVGERGRDARRKRLLVFIVAYHAESTIDSVLARIPNELTHDFDVEVLIIDDGSRDATFSRADENRQYSGRTFPIHLLYNPINLGYGETKKSDTITPSRTDLISSRSCMAMDNTRRSVSPIWSSPSHVVRPRQSSARA